MSDHLRAPPSVDAGAHESSRKVDREDRSESVDYCAQVRRELAHPDNFHPHAGEAGQEENR